ncbi:MAG: NosD domain-containing protein [Methanomicrobiales archaeon]
MPVPGRGSNRGPNPRTVQLRGPDSNIITGNWITGNKGPGIEIRDSEDNWIYNNYFNNSQNAVVTSGDNSFENVLNIPGPVSSNHWSVTPTPGPNIVNGPYIGGNYWATPTRTGWSQTHPDIGNGFTIPYDINSDGLNIDTHPLTLNGPAPTPSPSGTSGTFTPYSMTFELPYDATFTGNTVPANMQPCNSYNVLLTVKNTGTLNWSSANGVYLASSSTNGFTFDPSKYPIPAGVVVHPGDSYTFPVTINVPCPMNSGTYPLRFSLFYTLQTREGPVTLPFGEALIDNVNVGTTTATSSGRKDGSEDIHTVQYQFRCFNRFCITPISHDYSKT